MSLILACFSTGLAMAATAQVHLEELSPDDHQEVPKNVFKKKKKWWNTSKLWKDWIFAWRAVARQNKRQWHQFMGRHKSVTSSFVHPNLFWRLSNKFLCAMEGSMIFCQKNILEHFMKFHGDYLKRCLLAHIVSQIL